MSLICYVISYMYVKIKVCFRKYTLKAQNYIKKSTQKYVGCLYDSALVETCIN